MAEIKSFQEGWNNKHKEYLKAKEDALKAINNGMAEVERFELKRQNLNREVTIGEIEDLLLQGSLVWELAQKAIEMDPNKKNKCI